MRKNVVKPPKIALCRECNGTGFRKISVGGTSTQIQCPQCEGSGRVLVKCKMDLDIRPYKKNK
ncbi:YuiA family protein [Prevotella melaninogenica]|uniref:YuiA family protein n=1 Tax=Prevotella melaninogenica TaxID=28132 RepID=UPI0028E2A059|nr:YuiA family protein [Prevotella melaninogenica]